MKNSPFSSLKPIDDDGHLNVIIDTPRGSRNKYVFNFKEGVFKLGGTLTAGHYFPYDFGFLPHTRGGDDDSLDVLVLMDEAGFSGCWVVCRLIGAYQATQTENDGSENRNDRFIAVEAHSLIYRDVKSIDDLDPVLADQIEHFFVSYNQAKGKRFEVFKRATPHEASELIRAAIIAGEPEQE